MSNGWIKLHRQMQEWEWYTCPNTCHLFIHILFKVNHIPKMWRGIEIKTGQCITSLVKLSGATGLTIQEIRTALEHLKETGEVTCTSTNKFTLIEVSNYEKYQLIENKQQTNNTSTNNHSNNKQEVKKIISNIHTEMFSEFERISKKEVRSKTDKRISSLNARLNDFTQDEIKQSWAAMTQDSFLNGDNQQGKDYFTIDYALRPDTVEKYLEEYKKLV